MAQNQPRLAYYTNVFVIIFIDVVKLVVQSQPENDFILDIFHTLLPKLARTLAAQCPERSK